MQQVRFLRISDGGDIYLVNIDNILFIEDNRARLTEIHFKESINGKKSIVVQKPLELVEDLIKDTIIRLV